MESERALVVKSQVRRARAVNKVTSNEKQQLQHAHIGKQKNFEENLVDNDSLSISHSLKSTFSNESNAFDMATTTDQRSYKHLLELGSSSTHSRTNHGGSKKKKIEVRRSYIDPQSSPESDNSFTNFKRQKNSASLKMPSGGDTPVTTQKSSLSLNQSASSTSSHGGGGDIKHKMRRKSISINDAKIMTALARSEQNGEPDLIGDLSKPYALPLLATGQRHTDLKTISSETLAQLICGEFLKIINSFQIVDCRYPYEYDGGHIHGARNLYTHDQILETFPILQENSPTKSGVSGKSAVAERNIIIFHCEFSSERGPKMMRFLRSIDRSLHCNMYPALDYPELYLLHNGYKDFSEKYAHLCIPAGAYLPMLSPSHIEEFRYYQNKCISWKRDSLGVSTQVTKKKARSRYAPNDAN